MKLWNTKPKCRRFFTYKSSKIDIKGLSADLPEGMCYRKICEYIQYKYQVNH